MSNTKKLLTTVLVVGGLSAVIGAGTFASFSAQTTNKDNTFETGTLILSNKVGTAAACFSNGGIGASTDNNAADCSAVYDVPLQKPGDSVETDLKIKNEGTLDGGALTVDATACVNSNTATEVYHGTGNPCGQIRTYVQQWDDADHTNAVACLYGLDADSDDVCDAAYPSPSHTLDGLAGAGAITADSAFENGDEVFVTVGVELPLASNNSYQGRTAVQSLVWDVAQGA